MVFPLVDVITSNRPASSIGHFDCDGKDARQRGS